MCSYIFAPFTLTVTSHFLSPMGMESVGPRNYKYYKLHSVQSGILYFLLWHYTHSAIIYQERNRCAKQWLHEKKYKHKYCKVIELDHLGLLTWWCD